MYVRTWRSRLECQFALMLRNWASLKHALHEDVDGGRSWGGTTFLGDGGRGGQRSLAESSAEMSAECSRQLVTLRKKKRRGQSTVEAKRARREHETVQK